MKTNHFGTRKSAENHNEFFEKMLQNPDVEPSTQEKNNGTLIHTSNQEKNTSQSSIEHLSNDTNQMLHLLLNKVNAIEDFLIKITVKLDNARDNPRLSKENQRNEIDISELKDLGLPAESASQIEKLETNLKLDDFRKKLVHKLRFNIFI